MHQRNRDMNANDTSKDENRKALATIHNHKETK